MLHQLRNPSKGIPNMEPPKNRDLCIKQLLEEEGKRLETELNLIASENYTSPEVMETMGSVPTKKYAEGYTGERYYGGCQVEDKIELLAIERAKKLYNAEHANV